MAQLSYGILLLILSWSWTLDGLTQCQNRRRGSTLPTAASEIPEYFREFLSLYKSDMAMMKEMKNDMVVMKTTVSKIDKEFERNQPLWVNAGSTFELTAKGVLQRIKGNAFVESLSIQTLDALACDCLPSNFDYDTGHVKHATSESICTAREYERVDKMSHCSYKRISRLKDWLSKNQQEKSNRRKADLLTDRLKVYDSLRTENEKVKFLCHDRLGFFGFTNHILKDSMKDGFIEELELDMRGHIDVTNFRVTREIAEIKSGGNILRKATLQLVKRLGVLYLAGKYCLPKKLESKYNFESIGRLYSAGKCESPDESLIDSCKEEAGLVDYPHIHIFMQRL